MEMGDTIFMYIACIYYDTRHCAVLWRDASQQKYAKYNYA